MPLKKCLICGNTSHNKTHTAREMMFGLRDRFDYLECGRCGCLQLVNPPDLSKYYPREYYSFSQHGSMKTLLRHRWSAAALGRRSFIGRLISTLFFPNHAMRALARLQPPKEARILDVGCGSGHLLLDLKQLGFPNVTGVDPFIEREIKYENGVTVFKRELNDLPGEYDIIMLHHCFEHMAEPAANLGRIVKLLARGGTVILRIPVASSFAWKRFGVNWVHLDAPRHLFLHTHASIALLAREVGLVVQNTIHESDEWTFWGSEAYMRDIPMSDPRFPQLGPRTKLLAWRKNREYRVQAELSNQNSEADSICFYLKATEVRSSVRSPSGHETISH